MMCHISHLSHFIFFIDLSDAGKGNFHIWAGSDEIIVLEIYDKRHDTELQRVVLLISFVKMVYFAVCEFDQRTPPQCSHACIFLAQTTAM